jgi:hypothetical protein
MSEDLINRWLLASASILMLVFLGLWQFESWRAGLYQRLARGRWDQIERYSLVLVALLEYLEGIGPALSDPRGEAFQWSICAGCGAGQHSWAHIEHTEECILAQAERLADFARDQLGEVAVIILKEENGGS